MVLGLIFVLVHLIFWFSLTVVESFESRTGRISARRGWNDPSPFPYFCDWHTATWGDLVGISLLDWSAGYACSLAILNIPLIALSVVVGAVVSIWFHVRCMSAQHRPDSGYPERGKISLLGRAHVAYFFIQAALCTVLLVLAVSGALRGLPLAIALFGGAVYVASFLFDWYPGRYALAPKT